VYGPVCTVVWQGSAGDRRPYADQTGLSETGQLPTPAASPALIPSVSRATSAVSGFRRPAGSAAPDVRRAALPGAQLSERVCARSAMVPAGSAPDAAE
jgi:hypothetical protein